MIDLDGACPACGVSWRGDPIPQEYRDKGWYGDKTHFSRLIGVEYPERYDGVWEWVCPDCHKRFPRFTKVGDPYEPRIL